MIKRPTQTASRGAIADIVVHRLEALAPLSPEAVELLRRLEPSRPSPPGSDLIDERASSPRPRFMIGGWAARVRWLSDGRRQNISFVTPGDAIALELHPSPIARCPTVALTQVQTLDAAEVAGALRSPDDIWAGLKEAVGIAASLDECAVLNQVVRLGRQTGFERMCHLLLELRDRMSRAGLADGQRFGLPLTQDVLGDATGLSTVHVNRILQQMRREKLVDLRNGHVELLKPEELASIADYRVIQPSAWRRAD